MGARSKLIALCFILALSCEAQTSSDDFWLNYFEVYSDDQELFELLQIYKLKPLHINKASTAELLAFPLLNAQQIHRLIALRMKYGEILSIYELQQLPGISKEMLRALQPYISITEGGTRVLSRHSLSLQTDLSKPYTKAQLNGKYKGDASRSRFRYTYRSTQFEIGLRLNKDPGEAWLNSSVFPFIDHSSAYLLLQDIGKLRTLIIGDLAMSYGQGLHLSTTSFVGGMQGIEQLKMNASRISAYRSNNPDLRFTGIGAGIDFNHFSIDLIRAKQYRSGTIENGYITGSSMESGLHRTENELKRMNKIELNVTAINIQKEGIKYKAGVLISRAEFNKNFSVPTALYQLYNATSRVRESISIYYQKLHGNMMHFGELMPRGNELSLIEGMVMSFDKLDISSSYRRYAKSQHHLNTVSFGRWSNSASEEGLYSSVRYQFTRYRSLFIGSDLYHSNWLRHSSPSLSHGKRYSLQYRTKLHSGLTFQFSLRYEDIEIKTEKNKLSQLNTKVKTGARADLQWKSSLNEELRFRLEYKRMNKEHSGSVYVDHRTKINYRWSTALRFALYHIANSDLAIYSYERVAPGMNPSSAYFNSGNTFYLFVHFKASSAFQCFFKYSIYRVHGEMNTYGKEMSFGSADNERLGNRKHTFALQLQLVI